MYFIKKKKIFLVFFFILFCIFNLLGDKSDEENKRVGEIRTQKNGGILISPILFYLPETHVAFGTAANYVFRPGDKNGDNRPSTISPLLIYTQNKQFKTLLTGDIYLKNGDYNIIADIVFRKYPDKFFGIGGNVADAQPEHFTPHIFGIEFSILRRLKRHIHVGLKYDFSKFAMKEYEEGKLLAKGDIPGSQGSLLSGLSLLANLDSRDNIFFPASGEFIKFTIQLYNRIIGSEFTFQSYRLDIRKYFPLFFSHVLAIQSIVQTQTGTVPFQKLSKMGGQYVMRGYYEGRYRDRNAIILQAEYRLPLFWRFRAVGFAGAANVAHRFRDFKVDNLKYSYGLGLRYLFNKHEKMYVRFDVGFGKGTSGFYFSVFEAF